jgi:hypothetical protein
MGMPTIFYQFLNTDQPSVHWTTPQTNRKKEISNKIIYITSPITPSVHWIISLIPTNNTSIVTMIVFCVLRFKIDAPPSNWYRPHSLTSAIAMMFPAKLMDIRSNTLSISVRRILRTLYPFGNPATTSGSTNPFTGASPFTITTPQDIFEAWCNAHTRECAQFALNADDAELFKPRSRWTTHAKQLQRHLDYLFPGKSFETIYATHFDILIQLPGASTTMAHWMRTLWNNLDMELIRVFVATSIVISFAVADSQMTPVKCGFGDADVHPAWIVKRSQGTVFGSISVGAVSNPFGVVSNPFAEEAFPHEHDPKFTKIADVEMYGPINPTKCKFHSGVRTFEIDVDGWRVPLTIPSTSKPFDRIYVKDTTHEALHRVWLPTHRPDLLQELLVPVSGTDSTQASSSTTFASALAAAVAVPSASFGAFGAIPTGPTPASSSSSSHGSHPRFGPIGVSAASSYGSRHHSETSLSPPSAIGGYGGF